jgi:hypothetical protein
LQAALTKNVEHARNWLDAKDFKSLAQSAGSIQLLAEVLKARGDNAAWQGACDAVVRAGGEVQAAAAAQDGAKCKTAVEALQKTASAVDSLRPSGQAQVVAKPPAIRPLMLTMDAAAGAAKVALLTGRAADAKNQAFVLAELGKLASASRNTEQWSSLAGDFVSAATAAATATESEAKALRPAFRQISERCEACHEKSRMR